VNYYLLLLDRVERRYETFARIDPEKGFKARISTTTSGLRRLLLQATRARRRGDRAALRDHGSDRWRSMFRNVLAKLDEGFAGRPSQ